MRTSNNSFHWIPRILCIAAILFISMFAADAFAPGLSIGEQIRDFLIHLIPTFVLTAILILAWKRELIGGMIFTLLGLGLSPVVFLMNYNNNHSVLVSLSIILLITIPFVVVGILFIVSHRRKQSSAQTSVQLK